ncbi:MAG TPA: hypothetical protein PKX64_06755, partial [Elusimicrobiota bacterium]|nr:hypothetical protein [Elusimicrobiota bacterium]
PWNDARATRRFRGVTYQISIKRDSSLPAGSQKIVVDGKPLAGDALPLSSAKTVDVRVTVGPAR